MADNSCGIKERRNENVAAKSYIKTIWRQHKKNSYIKDIKQYLELADL